MAHTRIPIVAFRCWRSIGLSVDVWVDVRSGSQAKTKTTQAMQLTPVARYLWHIVGHFDMKKLHVLKTSKKMFKCHKGYSLIGVL